VATSPHSPTLRPAFVVGAIPALLKKEARWAPWRAKWNDKRGKWDKVPCSPTAPFHGLSTNKPERWGPFTAALQALQAQPERFAGLGYLMTRLHGLVGIDLDSCVADGVVAPWAMEIVAALGSYAEISPSGRGLRIFVRGETLSDWTNHEVGIEVYSGHEARFLTVTGDHLPGTPSEVRQEPPGVLEGLAQRYARERSSAPAGAANGVITLEWPDLVDELALPDARTLGLPYAAVDFLTEGACRGDRSRELFAAAVALHQAGLDDATVFSVLVASPHAMEVALDHRRQDTDRALTYLWVEHAQKAKGRGSSRVASADDFEVVGPARGAADTAAAAPRPGRFAALTLGAFMARPPVRWTVKRVLPEQGVGMIFGPSTAGKSFFALDLVLAVARGVEWRGRKVRQGSVVYVIAEGAGGFPGRLQAYAEHHGVDLAGVPMRVIPAAPNLLDKADVKELVQDLRAAGPLRLIVVDTLAQATPGADENSGQDMGRALAHCQVIAKATGALVLLIGHPGKDESRGVRGWSGMFAAFDVVLQIERSDDYRAATVAKMKDGQGEGDEFPFTLHSVTLGQDEDGEDITSCVLAPRGQALPMEQRKRAPKGNVERLVLRTAGVMRDFPAGVTTHQLIEAAVNELPAPEGKRDRRREVVLRAIEALVADNHLSVTGGFVSVEHVENSGHGN
jgi:hypothetical protein